MSWGRKRWRSDGLTRYERGMNIPEEEVGDLGPGRWYVMASQSSEDYIVERVRFRCTRRDCVIDERPCQHRYTCSCPDWANPCKHIYRVHSLDMEPKPPRPTAAEVQETVNREKVALRALVNDLGGVIEHSSMDVNVAKDLRRDLRAAVEKARRALQHPPRDPTDDGDSTDWSREDDDTDDNAN